MTTNTTDNTAKIAEIDAILRSGVTQHIVDGVTVIYDFAELRKQRRQLADADAQQSKHKPVASVIKLGGV